MPNRLIEETSPYLLQHAHNPVDWYPWGPEALERAKKENKPILLSIGYAACHWCHVMERESFEDPGIAAVMNGRFVCIKVDREERPDIDAIYMDAVQAMTGRGGWPMTMFLTPDGKPFFGGTYFPPADVHGMPSFRTVLDAVYDAWLNRKTEIAEQTRAIVERINNQVPSPSREPLQESLIPAAVDQIGASFDWREGGSAGAPKFPQGPVLEFLLRAGAKGLDAGRAMARLTLTKMALGGIYDHLGGGFARYSVDDRWLVPHFEKMLYDNAQLARIYTRAWQMDKSELFKRIANETLDYLIRDMRDEGGAFYASEDADSEGQEGKFYVWSYDDFISHAPEAAGYYGATPAGNFEGLNILTGQAEEPPSRSRETLLQVRSARVRPARDEKILTSWNGMTISALAEAGAAFGNEALISAARDAASFLLENSTDDSGRLRHSFKDGQARVLGLLEDYALFAEGLLTLWEATFEKNWLIECERVCRSMLDLFLDRDAGGLYATGSDHEQLIARPKELIDGATPSPNGIAALVLQKLAVITGDKDLAGRGVQILRLGHVYMTKAPQVACSLLSALDFYTSTPKEVVLLGDRDKLQPFISELWSRLIPNKVVAGGTGKGPLISSPMLDGKKPLDGRATAFVCENYTCLAPTTNPTEFGTRLRADG